ncbi:MAG: hypothetical protein JNK85_23050 [Verrucomicrobiales bacterium]|nr:hypothetical protein [Verrucomicrobiales bacterium]
MRWSTLVPTLLLAAAAILPSRAQSSGVAIELVLRDSVFLPGEEIPVGVRISNLAGRPLTFGSSSNWLIFYAESKQGDIVSRTGHVPVEGEFTLESAKAGTKWWNIQPAFDLTQSGNYLIYAEVRLPDWSQREVSEPVSITIQPARNMWESTFGVPPADPSVSSEPEIRRYALQAATRDRERRLYARVTDESSTQIYRVVYLDRLLSFANPDQQLDNSSRLHVLFQTGGSSYTYCVLDPSGELVIRQRHDIVPGSRPRLAKNDDGTIAVAGGKRAPTVIDIPPYVPPPAATNSDPSAVSVTNAPSTGSSTDKKSTREERRKKRRESTEKQ